MVLSQRLHEAFKGAVERMTSPRTVSAFKEKGVLTPDEFVQAGDNLVSKCPTWSWYNCPSFGFPKITKSVLNCSKSVVAVFISKILSMDLRVSVMPLEACAS